MACGVGVVEAIEPRRAESRSRKHPSVRRAGALALAAVAILVGSAFGGAPAFADTPSPLAWNFGSVDPSPNPSSFSIGLVSCPSESLCVALGVSGDLMNTSAAVITSTDPSKAWRVSTIGDQGPSFRAISCASTNLCVAVDSAGNVITSTDPTGGSAAWVLKSGVSPQVNMPGSTAHYPFNGISCPTTTLCVAVSDDGSVESSTDPADGASAVWHTLSVNPGPVAGGLSAISCASATMCVATGQPTGLSSGLIFATTTPTTTVASDWKSTSVAGPLAAISCPSSTLCVGIENPSFAVASTSTITSSDPTGSSPGWATHAGIDSGNEIFGLACSSATLCVAADSSGNVLTATNPAGDASSWSSVALDRSGHAAVPLACAPDPFCVAVGHTPVTFTTQLWTTFAPAAGESAWTVANTAVPLDGVSCPSLSLCAAVDDIGNVLTSTNPSSGSPSGSIVQATGPTLLSITCPTTTRCVATDVSGDVVTSTNPTGGSSAWTTTNVDGTEAILSVSCPTANFCAAVDDAGNVLTATNPTAGPWIAASIDGTALITGISCPTASFCAAVDDSGNVLVSTDPTGGAAAWQLRSVDFGNLLLAISCLSSALCVAVDDDGNVVTSTAPTSASSGWTSANVDDSPLEAVSCPSTTMCVAVDDSGFEINSINPAGGANEWTGTQINAGPLYGVSCPDTSGCAVVDGNGNAAWGGSTPSNVTLPSITGQTKQGSQLTEVHGTWTPSPTSYSTQWERCNAAGASCSDITGAISSSYTLAAADVGSTIRVLELASNANGDGATVESTQTTVVQVLPTSSSGTPGPPPSPSGGAGTATVKRTTTSGANARILVSCTGGAGATCSLALRLTVNETIKRGKVIAVTARTMLKKKTVMLGTTTVKLKAGQSELVKVSLNAAGRRLLSQRHTLKVKLAIAQSAKTISSTTITFKVQPKKKH